MAEPLGNGNIIEWYKLIHHRSFLNSNQTVEQAHREMLAKGIDYAVVVDDDNFLLGMVSFKMVSAALSAKFGQALYAEKSLHQTRIPRVIFGPVTKSPGDEQLPLIISIEETAVFRPSFDFFVAQTCPGTAFFRSQL